MKKQLMVSLLTAGLLLVMLPSASSAGILPDPQANGFAGVCRSHGGTFAWNDLSDSGPRYNEYKCDGITNPILAESDLLTSLKSRCISVIRVRGGYDYVVFAHRLDGTMFSCSGADLPD